MQRTMQPQERLIDAQYDRPANLDRFGIWLLKTPFLTAHFALKPWSTKSLVELRRCVMSFKNCTHEYVPRCFSLPSGSTYQFRSSNRSSKPHSCPDFDSRLFFTQVTDVRCYREISKVVSEVRSTPDVCWFRRRSAIMCSLSLSA